MPTSVAALGADAGKCSRWCCAQWAYDQQWRDCECPHRRECRPCRCFDLDPICSRTRTTPSDRLQRCSQGTRHPSRRPRVSDNRYLLRMWQLLNLEMRNMQRWRFIWFVSVASVLLGAPGWLLAQEPAKKAAPPAPSPAATAPVPTPAAEVAAAPTAKPEFHWFAFTTDKNFRPHGENRALGRPGNCDCGFGLCPRPGQPGGGADQGTQRMRDVGAAIRQGANAYLTRQFQAIAPLMVVITGILWATASADTGYQVALGRAAAFFMGATFSWLVGFVGMSLAVRGNLRVAAAARTTYGGALQLGYRTGTITGMLTDGLGLLGGTLIFMAYGEHAYEVLLGFGFGGTLLALFMRVGGGIYTKAADVALTWWARLRQASLRMIPATPLPSPTTSATMSVTVQAWPLTFSRAMR